MTISNRIDLSLINNPANNTGKPIIKFNLKGKGGSGIMYDYFLVHVPLCLLGKKFGGGENL